MYTKYPQNVFKTWKIKNMLAARNTQKKLMHLVFQCVCVCVSVCVCVCVCVVERRFSFCTHSFIHLSEILTVTHS